MNIFANVNGWRVAFGVLFCLFLAVLFSPRGHDLDTLDRAANPPTMTPQQADAAKRAAWCHKMIGDDQHTRVITVYPVDYSSSPDRLCH